MSMLFPLVAMQATTVPMQEAQGPPAPAEPSMLDPHWLIETLRLLAVNWGLKVLGAIILLIVTWMLAAWLRKIVHRAINRPHVDQTFGRFLGNMVRWIVIIIGLVACLGIFGVNTTSLAAMIGAAGLAIGLALQGSLSNLAGGIMLLMLRPFKVGDFIQVSGILGTVYEIELFNVKLNGPDNRRIILPNSQVFGSTIENFTHNETRRADVTIGVTYAADTAKTREVLLRALRSIPKVLAEPPPEAFLLELGASSVNWRVSGWCKPSDFGAVKQAICEAAKKELEAATMSIPFPQMELRILKDPTPSSPAN